MYRGSRKHVLDWVEQPRFLPELLALVEPVHCRVTPASLWQPLSYRSTAEARLEQFGPKAIPGHSAWPTIRSWWLKHAKGANTPNWDIALSCEVEGIPGFILVEAKANVPELSDAPKRPEKQPSAASEENQIQIAAAIAEARLALQRTLPGICIDRDKHYQLSNRIAFVWKLASMGIPTVLVYLGFTGDTGIRDAGEPFRDDKHWQGIFSEHLASVCPSPVIDRRMDMGSASFWILARSRPILEISPQVI